MAETNQEVDYAITVSQLNEYIQKKFSSDTNLKSVTIKGEVSNFTNHASGNFYFSLKDNESSIRGMMMKYNAAKVKFNVKSGMNLVITGSVSSFPRDGVYQIYCETMQPDGIGSLALALDQLKEKLNAKRYFAQENKKRLPPLPRNIGLVTSATGAALQDILNILTRRYPIGTVIIFPTLVQGESSANSIVQSIKKAELTGDIDVLIVGRGGGSKEDLWSFNEEIVATAIYQCKIPIISAVGHEIDHTIADMVADVRAPTPSAAAELVAPDIVNIQATINAMRQKLDELMKMRLYSNYQQVLTTYNKLKANSPGAKLEIAENNLIAKSKRLQNSMTQMVAIKEQKMLSAVSTLDALSPLKVLTRGYSITYDDAGNIITEDTQVKTGDKIITKLTDSQITSIVE